MSEDRKGVGRGGAGRCAHPLPNCLPPPPQAAVDAAQRDSVRAKLAQLVAANAALCVAGDAAAAAARGLEAAVHAPGAARGVYTSAATALAAAVRKAAGWWQLEPWAGKVPAREAAGRRALLEAAVAAAEAAAAAAAPAGGGGEPPPGASQAAARAVKELGALAAARVDAALLAATGAGKRVRALGKCAGELGAAAGRVVDAWKGQVRAAAAAAREAPAAGAAGGAAG
jgi:hypothetical protein